MADTESSTQPHVADLCCRALITCTMLFLTSCATPDSLESGGAVSTSIEERLAIGEALGRRLAQHSDALPLFSTRRRVSQEEILILTRFSETIPGGRFILGGNPRYLFRLKKQERTEAGSVKILTYTVTLLDADTKETIAEGSQYGKCNDSEAMLTFPTRCSIQRPLVLQRALEKL